MKCPHCNSEVRAFDRFCVACGHDNGFPNVRAAQKRDEETALGDRFAAAEASASARGCADVYRDFGLAVGSSKGVICRSLSQAKALVSSDNELYASFYQLVRAGVRRPEETVVERQRALTDELLFPHYRHEMRFGALSLDGRGAASWGECSIVLKDVAIRSRATVFEENSIYFCERLKLGVHNPLVPLGRRATWGNRHRLAAAKLETSLETTTTPEDFAGILLAPSSKPRLEGFVEVHIYGPLHRDSIERLVIRKPKPGTGMALLRALARFVTVETY